MTPYYALNVLDDGQARDISYTALESQDITGWFGSGVKRQRVPLFGVNGNTIAIKWVHNAVDENFIFYPSELMFQWKTKNLIV
jgi:hypothetical protein